MPFGFTCQFGNTFIPQTFGWLIDINYILFKALSQLFVFLFLFALNCEYRPRFTKVDTVSHHRWFGGCCFRVTIANTVTQNFKLENVDSKALAGLGDKLHRCNSSKGEELAVTVRNATSARPNRSQGLYFTGIIIGFVSLSSVGS